MSILKSFSAKVLLAVSLAVLSLPILTSADTWAGTGSMTTQRRSHSAVKLDSGKVLVAGGAGGGQTVTVLNSAELYDPATGAWSTTGSMNTPREDFAATLLPGGKVLAVGGSNRTLGKLSSAELYDPSTGTWTPTGSMNVSRGVFTATVLPNDKVLVVGGASSNGPAEIYDPATGTWSTTSPMTTLHSGHTATLLPNGKVLVVGGTLSAPTAELYDYTTGTWTAAGSMSTIRYQHTATLLPNGKVLVLGGTTNGELNGSGDIASAELYDPTSNAWTAAGSMTQPRARHVAILLEDGQVLVAGGNPSPANCDPNFGCISIFPFYTELFDPAAGTSAYQDAMIVTRHHHTATLLDDGRVLVAGGSGGQGFPSITPSAELYGDIPEINRFPTILYWIVDPFTSGNPTVDEGQHLQVTPVVLDPNYGEIPSFSLFEIFPDSIPSGMTMDSQTGVIDWTPTYDQAGVYKQFGIRIVDGGNPPLVNIFSSRIDVNNVNRVPILNTIGDKTTDEEQTLQFTVTASDPDLGDTVTLSINNLPSGASFDPQTGIFTWTPASSAGGHLS